MSNNEAAKAVWSSMLNHCKENIHEQVGDVINSVLLYALAKMGNDCISDRLQRRKHAA
jgi:hypothetical protein